MARIIHEHEFRERIACVLRQEPRPRWACVLGPGRSGAVASVYASHLLGIPWIPWGTPVPPNLRPPLVIDTAAKSGRTLRRACRLAGIHETEGVALYDEPPRLRFWYEEWNE